MLYGKTLDPTLATTGGGKPAGGPTIIGTMPVGQSAGATATTDPGQLKNIQELQAQINQLNSRLAALEKSAVRQLDNGKLALPVKKHLEIDVSGTRLIMDGGMLFLESNAPVQIKSPAAITLKTMVVSGATVMNCSVLTTNKLKADKVESRIYTAGLIVPL